jgi:hypothetical protein
MSDDHDDKEEENKHGIKGKLPNLDDWDKTFKQLGQKSYKEIWGKNKK